MFPHPDPRPPKPEGYVSPFLADFLSLLPAGNSFVGG